MRIFENIKVFSVCDTLTEKDYESYTAECSPDCFKLYTVEDPEKDSISKSLIEAGAIQGEDVLIEIDY